MSDADKVQEQHRQFFDDWWESEGRKLWPYGVADWEIVQARTTARTAYYEGIIRGLDRAHEIRKEAAA